MKKKKKKKNSTAFNAKTFVAQLTLFGVSDKDV